MQQRCRCTSEHSHADDSGLAMPLGFLKRLRSVTQWKLTLFRGLNPSLDPTCRSTDLSLGSQSLIRIDRSRATRREPGREQGDQQQGGGCDSKRDRVPRPDPGEHV